MSWLVAITERAIVAIDGFALIIVVIGTVEAVVATVRAVVRPMERATQWQVYANYGRWLVAGLTFQLAADILETSITTTWQAVARLGAAAAIRTFLNYFLEQDMSAARARRLDPAP